MATKNPFSLLAVHRDEDDEENTTKTQAVPASTGPLFGNTQAGDQKKKKKVRPEEKKKLEENQPDDEEGFSVVKKKGPTKPRVQAAEEESTEKGAEKPKKFKKPNYQLDKDNKFNSEKRLFERHSGTGRGKEISKGGAGGKHTWGTNPKNVPREEYNNDEALFNSAFNPDARPRRRHPREENQGGVQEKVEEAKVEVKAVEEVKVEEVKVEEVKVEEPKAEDVNAEADNRRKKKKGGEEVKQEELLERPENALSVTEYLEQLKQKNQAISQPKKVVQAAANNDLQVKQVNEAEFEIGLTNVTKKQKKNKEKKTETKDKELNFVVQTEATVEKKFDNKGNKRSHGNGTKFNFNDEEFPEL